MLDCLNTQKVFLKAISYFFKQFSPWFLLVGQEQRSFPAAQHIICWTTVISLYSISHTTVSFRLYLAVFSSCSFHFSVRNSVCQSESFWFAEALYFISECCIDPARQLRSWQSIVAGSFPIEHFSRLKKFNLNSSRSRYIAELVTHSITTLINTVKEL